MSSPLAPPGGRARHPRWLVLVPAGGLGRRRRAKGDEATATADMAAAEVRATGAPGPGPEPDPGEATTWPRGSRAARVATAWSRLLLATMPVLAVLYLTEVPRRVGIVPWRQQYVAVVLAAALGAVFVRSGLRRSSLAAAFHLCLSPVAVAALLYTAWRWPELTGGARTAVDLAVGLVVLVLVLEASRHTVGRVLFVLGVVAVLYGMASNWIPGILGADIPWNTLVGYLHTDASGIMGSPVIVTATVVLAFILFGSVLLAVGGGDAFVDLAMSLVGRFRGGPAKAAVIASSLFGSVSGSAVSNVVTTGTLTIPLMKRNGHPAHVAGAVEAVASTGGQLLPPVMGITAFLIADFLAMPYTQVAIAAALPAVLLYVGLYAQVHLEAVRAAQDQPLADLTDIPRLRDALRRAWILLVPIGVIVYHLFVLATPAGRAALNGTAAALVCGVVARRGQISARWIMAMLEDAGRKIVDLLVITAVAGVIIGVLSLTGMAFDFTSLVQMMAGDRLILVLVVTGLVALVLGMGMPTAGVYVLLAVTAAPAIVAVGVPPLAAHLFLLYYGMLSMITPPICLAAFAAAPLAEADPMRTGFAALRLGLPIYLLPFVFVYSPSLLLIDAPWSQTVVVFASAAVGLIALAVALTGFWRSPLRAGARALVATVGLLLVSPMVELLGVTGALVLNVALVLVLVAAAVVMARNGERAGAPAAAPVSSRGVEGG